MTSHDPSPTKNVIQTYFTAVATKEMPLIPILYQQCPERLLKSTGKTGQRHKVPINSEKPEWEPDRQRVPQWSVLRRRPQ